MLDWSDQRLGLELHVFSAEKDRLTIYAAQADPKDDSHFTIDVLVNGRRTSVDGYVQNGGRVVLKPREGPFGPSTWLKCESTWTFREAIWSPPGTTLPAVLLNTRPTGSE